MIALTASGIFPHLALLPDMDMVAVRIAGFLSQSSASPRADMCQSWGSSGSRAKTMRPRQNPISFALGGISPFSAAQSLTSPALGSYCLYVSPSVK